MQILDSSKTDRYSSEILNTVATDQTRVHDAMLAALDLLIMTMVELDIKSLNEFSGRGRRNVVQEPYQEM